jgi:hypothetical protein
LIELYETGVAYDLFFAEWERLSTSPDDMPTLAAQVERFRIRLRKRDLIRTGEQGEVLGCEEGGSSDEEKEGQPNAGIASLAKSDIAALRA